jgi:hypothetical protein
MIKFNFIINNKHKVLKMNFIYTLTSKDRSFSNKVILNTDHKLTSLELANLKKNPTILEKIIQKQDAKMILLDWKDLNIEILSMEKLPSQANTLDVSEIAIGSMKKLQSTSLVTKLENLMDAWPECCPLLQFIWKLLLSPLLFIFRFFDKNREVVLRDLEDLDQSFDYNNYQDFLNEYNAHLGTLIARFEDHSEGTVGEVKNYLIEMKRQGSLLAEDLKKAEKPIYDLAVDLVKEACKKMDRAEDGKETALMSLPIGFYQKNGKFQPLFATFYLEKERKLRIDLNGVGNACIEPLQASYYFEKPTQALLADLTHQLCILSNPVKEIKPVELSYREKIRIKVMHQFHQENSMDVSSELQDPAKFDAPQWIHESLCMLGGVPLKISGEKETFDKTLKGIVGQDLMHFFPQAPLSDKMDFLIKLIEEHYEKFMKARPYLSEAKQIRQIELLKFRVKKLEDHLVKRMDPQDFSQLRKVNQAFDQFFQKVDQIETTRKAIQSVRRISRADEIDKGMIKNNGNYEIKAHIEVIPPFVDPLSKKEDPSLEPYQVDLNALADAVAVSSHQNVLEMLKKIEGEADKLIDQKDYFTAKRLSLQALKYLPMPEGKGLGFLSKKKEEIVLQIVKLNKHIWESALRLQENAPEKDQLLQMIKSQLIASLLFPIQTLDKEELQDILKLHPHYRFGWLPHQLTEVNQILNVLSDNNIESKRFDTFASGLDLSFKGAMFEVLRFGLRENFLGSLQFMLTCLMKPDFTIYPFYGTGQVNEAFGVNYLDSLVKGAVEKGAISFKEKTDMIKALKYEDNQKRLKELRRLDFSRDKYVTHKACIKIFDRFSPSKAALAYLPNGVWLDRHDAYSSKYTFSNNQSNSKDFVGSIRGEETYLTIDDDETIQRSSPDLLALIRYHNLDSHLEFNLDPQVATLSRQQGMTEPTQLQKNLEKDPKGQINQVDNYVLETLQVALTQELSSSSVYEALNLIRTHPYLLQESEFQKTLFLVITRPQLLGKAIEDNPLYFEILAEDIVRLIREKGQNKGVAPFLILLADILKEHILQESKENPELKQIVQKLPGFEAKITLGDQTKTSEEWLHEWVIDPEKDLASNALAYMYSSYKKPLNPLMTTSELALLMHAASIFQNSGDRIGIPLFNQEINQWIRTQLISHIQKVCDKQPKDASQLLNDWIRLSTGNPGYSGTEWKKLSPSVYENEQFKIDLKRLHIESKDPNFHFEGVVVDLPLPVARSITKLFGLAPIRAHLRPGQKVTENYYDFQYHNELYTIYYNQANSDIIIYRKLPVDMCEPKGEKEWFQLTLKTSHEKENLSGIEKLIENNGLWVYVQKSAQAYLYVYAPSEGQKEIPYHVALKNDGTIKKICDPVNSFEVVLDKKLRHQEVISFVNPQETVLLAHPGKNLIQEIRFLRDGSHLERQARGEWVYHNERLGDGYRWLTNLSDEQLILKERSSAKAFLDSLGDMHEKFIFPLTNGKNHVFIIHPYQIIAQKGLNKILFNREMNVLGAHLPPLTITFDENGKQEGHPAAFLYLAYYFSHLKNYRLAEHYLEKAKNASGSTATDQAVLESLENLFEQISLTSLRSTAFQLKAQLALKHIRTHQISKTVYEPQTSGELLNNLQNIARLHSLYEKRHHELKEGALTEQELYEINQYVKISMHNYVEKYQQYEAGKIDTLDVTFNDFKYFRKEKVPEESSQILTVLLMSDLNPEPSVDKLIENRFPNPEYILRNFFNFILAANNNMPSKQQPKGPKEISNEDNKKKALKKLQMYMDSPKTWEIKGSSNAQEMYYNHMAKNACKYLKLFFQNPNSGLSSEEIYNRLKKAKSAMPYFDRSFGVISSILDITFGVMEKVKGLHNDLRSKLQEILLIAPYQNNLALENIKGTYDKRKNGKHMSSLQAVLDVLQKDKPSFLAPWENQRIPEMILQGNFDLNQPRELNTLLRDSEARQSSALEMRHDVETLRLINKLENEIKNRKLKAENIDEDQGIKSIHEEFQALRKTLPERTVSAKSLEEAKIALKQKVDQLKTYFNGKEQKKSHNEENTQLLNGLALAEQKLAEEVQQRTVFSNDEISALRKTIDGQVIAFKKQDLQERGNLLESVKKMEMVDLQLKHAIDHPEIFTEHDLFQEILKAYKDPARSKALGDLQHQLTAYLFKYTAYLQFKKAQALLDAQPQQTQAAKALQMIHTALNEKRFEQVGMEPSVMRLCLVAEAREGIIYRRAQLSALQKIKDHPDRWNSLIMGIGKTSYIMPTVAEILSQQGKFVVLTVPEILLNANRQSLDKSSRALFDQAGLQFSLPMAEDLSYSFLAEKYAQLLKVIHGKGYVITSVDELCSLHNLVIQIEDEKNSLLKKWNNENALKIFHLEKKLHYLKKMSQLLHGEADLLNVDRLLFGDEVDTTNDISHEVNLAVGKVVPPNKIVRDSVRTILQLIFTSAAETGLEGLKKALLEDSQSVLKNKDLESYMHACAKALRKDPEFLKLLGPQLSSILEKIDEKEWSLYITGKSKNRPKELGVWDSKDNGKKYISAVKQLLTHTFKSLLSMKSGNEFGFSDEQGFLIVPKITKNETPGMRYGDEFELITAQYLGYLELQPCQSLTDASENFIRSALKTYQNKFPSKYELFIKDFTRFQQSKPENAQTSLIDFLKMQQAWKHRFGILDEVVFDGGFITRFNQQITTNVQEVYHGHMGGMTGTLDPYTLPFISPEVQFNIANKNEVSSTREVEAETLLRLTLNLPEGIHTTVQVYDSKNAMEHIQKHILKAEQTKAFVNNIGETSEGLDTLSWIEKLRCTPEGKTRSYLFPHPKYRIPYLWMPNAKEPLPYKNQKLPQNCICMYAPSDTRGVDLPIGAGDVHVLLGATTSLQELMQTLYRARGIGMLQKIILHISEAWKKQIQPQDINKGITYGDVVKYIVSRTCDNKEAINEAAQLQKITGQLKGVVSRYLRQTDLKFDEVDFWKDENIDEFKQHVLKSSEIFKTIRHLYIKSKEIDFAEYYEPVEIISGTDKLILAYKDLYQTTKELIGKLPTSSNLPGEFDLKMELETLLGQINGQQKELFKWFDEHEKYLPVETSTQSSKNVKETVKELQMAKIREVKKEEQPPAKISSSNEPKRKYQPLLFITLFNPINILKQLPSPFEDLYITKEAEEVLKTYGTRRGDPLLYLVMTEEKGSKPSITLVSKMDYHKILLPKLREGLDASKKLYVYSFNMHQFSQMDGTERNSQPLPNQFIAAKCFMGVKEYENDETQQLVKWLKTLTPKKRSDLLNYLREKTTQTLFNTVDALMQQGK